jgi:hypothetical protein
MLQGFADQLFCGALDVPCTYTPKDGLSFTTKAIFSSASGSPGVEAGKGLPRPNRQTEGELQHIRVPSADFEAPPEPHDILTVEGMGSWRVINHIPSLAGTYLLYAVTNTAYKGLDAGRTKR